MSQVRVRQGKDIVFNWTIKDTDNLSQRDLHLFRKEPNGRIVLMEHTIEGNILSAVFRGIHQQNLGLYTFSLWENYRKPGQTVTDSEDHLIIVKHTAEEDIPTDSGISVVTIPMSMGQLIVGAAGKDADIEGCNLAIARANKVIAEAEQQHEQSILDSQQASSDHERADQDHERAEQDHEYINTSLATKEEVNEKVQQLKSALDALTGTDDTTQVIDTFNEVISFLDTFKNDATLASALSSLRSDLIDKINEKQDIIPDIDTIRNLSNQVPDILRSMTETYLEIWNAQDYSFVDTIALPQSKAAKVALFDGKTIPAKNIVYPEKNTLVFDIYNNGYVYHNYAIYSAELNSTLFRLDYSMMVNADIVSELDTIFGHDARKVAEDVLREGYPTYSQPVSSGYVTNKKNSLYLSSDGTLSSIKKDGSTLVYGIMQPPVNNDTEHYRCIPEGSGGKIYEVDTDQFREGTKLTILRELKTGESYSFDRESYYIVTNYYVRLHTYTIKRTMHKPLFIEDISNLASKTDLDTVQDILATKATKTDLDTVHGLISNLQSALDTLTGTNDTTAIIDSMKEIKAFLDTYKNTDSLANILLALENNIRKWVDGITGDLSNLETENKSDLVSAINEANKNGGGGGGQTDIGLSIVDGLLCVTF